MQYGTHDVFSTKTILLTALVVILGLSIFIVDTALCQKKHLYDDLFGVTFPDENNGWTCGRWGSVFHTADGGKTWDKQESITDYTLSSIHFVDANNGWAVGDEGAIIHSADGGKTWIKQKSPVDFFLMDVFFLNKYAGWIATEETTILNTKDGGKTWTIQFQDQDYILKSISFADENNGWAVGEYGYIYHTADGGETWEYQAGFFDISDIDGHIVAGTFLFDVSAVDDKTAWACGIDSYVTMTENGGKTWKEIPTNIPKTHFFSIIADTSEGILISGSGTFVYSTDSGKTWRHPEFTPPIIYSYLYDVVPVSAKTFATVGRGGVIYLGALNKWTKADY